MELVAAHLEALDLVLVPPEARPRHGRGPGFEDALPPAPEHRVGRRPRPRSARGFCRFSLVGLVGLVSLV